jgi:LysM repeat protein
MLLDPLRMPNAASRVFLKCLSKRLGVARSGALAVALVSLLLTSRVRVAIAQPATLEQRATQSIGAISVGHPHAGFLVNGVAMPKDPRWVLTVPEHRFATEETIGALTTCIAKVHEQFPGSPPIMLGSLSARGGGFVPPHKSHRTGRDVDVYFYKLPGKRWDLASKQEDIDYPRSWALLKAFITEAAIDYVLLDREVQRWFRSYAESIGEDPTWLKLIFEGEGPYPNSAVKHAPGHGNHFHVRFASPLARARGRLLYDQLVLQGHVTPERRKVVHTVAKGDTLLAIAMKYGVKAATIVELNQLGSSRIKVGQKLTIVTPVDIRGARDPIVLVSFPKPEEAAQARARARSALDILERELKDSFGSMPTGPKPGLLQAPSSKGARPETATP